jgi:hypothetical protein
MRHTLIKRFRVTAIGMTLVALALAALPAQAASLRVTPTVWKHEALESKAFVIENDLYAATLVPSRGGRILSWYDKVGERNVIYDNGYGGLLDDHGPRIRLPYELQWIKKSPKEVVVQLSVQSDLLFYRKTVRFFADRPVIQVTYHLENHGQTSARMLFRNVVRPGGTEFSGKEIYCYSRIPGLQRGKGMPRTDDQADPWCALVDPAKKSIVAAAFEGDALERLYTWRGSKVAPTFEFMLKQLQPGRQMDATYAWSIAHGLTAIDYAHRAFMAQVEGQFRNGKLSADLDILATWAPMADLKISGQVLDSTRKPIATIAPLALPIPKLDVVMRKPLSIDTPAARDYVILVLTLQSKVLEAPIVVEKAFPLNGNAKLLADYRRPVRWVGAPVAQRPIAGWKKEVKYVIQPDAADRDRGGMVFEETGPTAGKRVKSIHFDLAQREPEAFPLHFHSLTRTGEVRMTATTPKGLSIETFVPEDMPQKLWGKVMVGLKLNPGDRFKVKPKDDTVLYFRLRAGEVAPGDHELSITFTMDGMAPIQVPITVKVYPIRFPNHPLIVFDVNNVVNYLCAKKKTYEWLPEKAHNFLADMEAHGVKGQTVNGVNAPNSYFWYNRVKVRETGEILTDAIKSRPELFRGRNDLPALDFSHWDPFIDYLLDHGMTHVRWPMGNPGGSYMKRHSKLTRLVYKRMLPMDDIRDMTLKEWYYREVTRYLKDRGITRVYSIIGDEIPSEKLAWWVQHANRCIQMGMEPGVTQSAETLADNTRINMVAPFMKYWIIGTLHKKTINLRRKQGIIKPEHRMITYHSSANHWQPYDQMRGHCGLNPAFFDLDACWIQTYFRWKQAEAVIYPGPMGPTGSAAWEGARDGLDDGNYLLLARAMIAALPDKAERATYTDRLGDIVGMKESSFIRFVDRTTAVGTVTTMGRMEGNIFKAGYDTTRFRQAKRKLLDLAIELAGKAPTQRAAANFGLHVLIKDGKSQFQIPAGMQHTAGAIGFLQQAAGVLAFDTPDPVQVARANPYPYFFFGTRAELKSLMPTLAAHPDLADLSDKHPAKGTYVIRFLRKQPNLRKKEKLADMPESMVILFSDEAGAQKARKQLTRVITPPRYLYSHWLLKHRGAAAK